MDTIEKIALVIIVLLGMCAVVFIFIAIANTDYNESKTECTKLCNMYGLEYYNYDTFLGKINCRCWDGKEIECYDLKRGEKTDLC